MRENKQSVLSTLTLILQLGITMIVPIVALTILGAYIGKRFDIVWLPVLFFVMGALGGAQGAWRIIRGVIKDWSYDPTSRQSLEENKEKQSESIKEDE